MQRIICFANHPLIFLLFSIQIYHPIILQAICPPILYFDVHGLVKAGLNA